MSSCTYIHTLGIGAKLEVGAIRGVGVRSVKQGCRKEREGGRDGGTEGGKEGASLDPSAG